MDEHVLAQWLQILNLVATATWWQKINVKLKPDLNGFIEGDIHAQ